MKICLSLNGWAYELLQLTILPLDKTEHSKSYSRIGMQNALHVLKELGTATEVF